MKHNQLHWTISILAALSLVFSLSVTALAADCASLDLTQAGSVTVALTDDEGASPTDGTLTIYQVAELTLDDGNMVYTLTEDFADCGVVLDESVGDLSAEDVSTLAGIVTDNALTGTEATVDESGTAVFTDLPLGVYLVVQTEASTGYYAVESFVVTVPLEEGEDWVYDVNASPKVATLTATPEEETTTPEDTTTTTTDTTLPQTGQLNWPVYALVAAGVFLIVVGTVLTKTSKKKSNEA